MATKSILWGNGNGSIFLDYTGQGDGIIAVTSDGNNLYTSRQKTITVSDGTTSRQVSITQRACPRNRGYLSFVADEDGTFALAGNNVFYSLDDGATWVELADGVSTPTILSGSRIIWKGSITPTYFVGVGTFSSTGNFHVEGNPMSLIFGDAFIGKTSLADYISAFNSLFKNCTTLTSIEGLYLPSTILSERCYANMFYGCSALTSVPYYLLPAQTLVSYCYADMFRECRALTIAPYLPAETLVEGCYTSMFRDCNALEFIQAEFTTIPRISSALEGWLNNVARYGIFIKNPLADWSRESIALYGTWALEERKTMPDGYKQLSHIASTKTGSEYIDLDLQMWSVSPLSYALDILCFVIGRGSDDSQQATFLSCLQESGEYAGFCIRCNYNTSLEQNRNPSTRYGNFGSLVNIIQSQGNGSDMDFTPDKGTTDEPLLLFCERSEQGVPRRFTEAKVLHLKIKSNGDDWVRDCVPAKNSNGTVGLYDFASRRFFTAAQGALVGGVEIA